MVTAAPMLPEDAGDVLAASEFGVGEPVGEVEIEVDYAIVKHFSDHLYSSPNKAIEELISNGFDALATKCYVYVPGEHVSGRVVVWDNGISMDEAGLKAMWQIAKSPKDALGETRSLEVAGRRRVMIGKFGIGKLASYAVGHRISHICRTTGGQYFSTSVNYRAFTEDDAPPSSSVSDGLTTNQMKTPIRELSETQAQDLARTLLPHGEALLLLDEPHWTIAVIGDLKPCKLYPGRLMWVLGNGMPLRPDFSVYVEDKAVTPRLASDAFATWSLAEPGLRDSLLSAWEEARSQGRVDGELDMNPPAPSPAEVDSDDPYAAEPSVAFPCLGRVSATVRLFERSLSAKPADATRSHGFFVTVHNRLINADDEKMLLNDPSFGTFYRSQFQIRANGLDSELLADRESLRRETPKTTELAVLQTALYRAARSEIERTDADTAKRARPESRLPSRSRELFRDPMAALIARSPRPELEINYDEPMISRVNAGQAAPLASVSATSGNFDVNRDHPFYKTVETNAGGGRKGAATMAAFDLFAVSERLTEGFLYSRGVDDDQVQDLFDWRDRLFRSLAIGYGNNPDDAVLEVRAASVEGDRRFELAVTALLNLMGFRADHHGAPGEADIVAVAPVGPDHTVFTVEAKGSVSSVENVTAAVASAAAHRDDVEGAIHALIVAREFAGFQAKDEPAVLKECTAVSGVSVVTVDTLVRLYDALLTYSYPLESVARVLFANENPNEKHKRVLAMERPLNDFNYREVLDAIWERQSKEAAGDQVSIRALWQSREDWKKLGYQTFTDKLNALDHMTGRLVFVDNVEKTVYMRNDPEHTAEHAWRSLASADRTRAAVERAQHRLEVAPERPSRASESHS